MGSPLSPVLSCLYMESLEKLHYLDIVGRSNTWLRYVDDVLVVINRRCKLDQVLDRLNSIEPKIQFTMEQESEDKLPFLDTVIHRTNDGPRFSVYRKPTNKDDFIHFYSGHSERTKTGAAMGFYLRAFRICSPEFLQEELDYITRAFKRLAYPESILLKLQGNAAKIIDRPKENDKPKLNIITAPMTTSSKPLQDALRQVGYLLVNPTGCKVKDLVRNRRPGSNSNKEENSIIYNIPCGTCEASYIGETGRGFKIRLREHQRDFTHQVATNALVQHTSATGHLPNWQDVRILRKTSDKWHRKALEAAYIQTAPKQVLNTSPGFFVWASAAAKLALNIPLYTSAS